jgi:hypothetical protein
VTICIHESMLRPDSEAVAMMLRLDVMCDAPVKMSFQHYTVAETIVLNKAPSEYSVTKEARPDI